MRLEEQLNINLDRIISKKNGIIIAVIQIENHLKDTSEYNAIILEDNFPDELLELISQFHTAVDEFSFSIIDNIESQIQAFDLYLESNSKKVFNIKIDDKSILFYSKFPTAKGFIDDYPT